VYDQSSRTGRARQAVPHRLLCVAYPGAPDSDYYLPNVLPEAEDITRHFAQVTSLYQDAATPEAVLTHSPNQDAVHFGCHGWFDIEQPEQSGLMLAGGWLTVQRIITELRLEQACLATLGTCLGGRAALRSGDEHVGLLQAMLTAGAEAVVSSLWPVDDAATRVLFETFYAELVAGCSPAIAMQEATRRVRTRPGWEHPYYWAAFQVSGLVHKRKEPL
jgi:CHAT domain-containing protein